MPLLATAAAAQNRTYDRWWQARSAFGGIGGGLINVVRQVATYTDDPVLLHKAQVWGMCMVYGVLQLVRNTPKVTDPRVAQLLEPDELSMYSSTTKPAKLCGSMLSALVSSAGLDMDREIHINGMLGQVAGNVSVVARIKLQALPYGESSSGARRQQPTADSRQCAAGQAGAC